MKIVLLLLSLASTCALAEAYHPWGYCTYLRAGHIWSGILAHDIPYYLAKDESKIIASQIKGEAGICAKVTGGDGGLSLDAAFVSASGKNLAVDENSAFSGDGVKQVEHETTLRPAKSTYFDYSLNGFKFRLAVYKGGLYGEQIVDCWNVAQAWPD